MKRAFPLLLILALAGCAGDEQPLPPGSVEVRNGVNPITTMIKSESEGAAMRHTVEVVCLDHGAYREVKLDLTVATAGGVSANASQGAGDAQGVQLCAKDDVIFRTDGMLMRPGDTLSLKLTVTMDNGAVATVSETHVQNADGWLDARK